MPFKDTNVALGINGSSFQAGVNDVDTVNPIVEKGFTIPWASDSAASWLYYECTVGVMLDSGIVVHNRLPQVGYTADTLAACDYNDPRLDVLKGGVNLKCRDQYTDIVQRMGHSRYWFRLWGQALRVGYQVPIPGLVTIGGVPAIPYDKNPQWAFNRIAPGGNYSGVILWHAAWSLWYTTAVPPTTQDIPASSPAAHISGKVSPPVAGQAPFTFPDDDARPAAPASSGGSLATGGTPALNIKKIVKR